MPWDDSHHPELSQTDGVPDGRWLFINGNNTPRVARIDLTRFETDEILEIPNAAGGHASPFTTPEHRSTSSSATRFSVPIPQTRTSRSTSYKRELQGHDLVHQRPTSRARWTSRSRSSCRASTTTSATPARVRRDGWFFFTSYNSEQAYTKLEVNASQNDKDYIAAVNWKKAEECVAEGKAKAMPANYCHNYMDDEVAQSRRPRRRRAVKVLDPTDCPGVVYYLPTPKSPHGVDVDPDRRVHRRRRQARHRDPGALVHEDAEGDRRQGVRRRVDGIPVLKYDAVMAGEVQKPGLGPLHTEFDGKGYAYTSMFISSEIVKWKLGTWEVRGPHADLLLDRPPHDSRRRHARSRAASTWSR